MNATTHIYTSTWLSKFFKCFVTYIFLRDLAYSYLPFDPFIFNSEAIYFGTLFTGWNLPVCVIIIIFSIWWHKKEKKGKLNSPALHEWLLSVMCYYASFLIFQYGFQKIYNNQFHQVYYREDSLAGKMSGSAIAWSFFNFSYYYTLLIGLLQIAGGTLLLFAKTRLAGSALLLPVMMNILLINFFYVVSPDAFVNAMLITITISYVLWLQRRKIIALFLTKRSDEPNRINYIKMVLRIMVLVFAFTTGYPYRQAGEGAFYTGKWKIIQLVRNGKNVDQQQWENDSMAWNNVYIENNRKIVFSANPNYYDYSKKRTVNYEYKPIKNNLLLTGKEDSAMVIVKRLSNNKMQWNTILLNDTLQLILLKDIKDITADR